MTKADVLHPARLEVTAEAIRAYAALTCDFNPIHLDADFAAATPMGGVIAHGTMSIGLLWQSLFATFGPDAAAGLELDLRFVRPVRIGDRLEAGGEPAVDAPGTWNVRVRGQDGEDRLVGTLRIAG